MLTPIDMSGTININNIFYHYLVIPFIADNINMENINSYLKNQEHYYIDNNSDEYEGLFYIELKSGLRVFDIHRDNFKMHKNKLYLVDYNEVDLH